MGESETFRVYLVHAAGQTEFCFSLNFLPMTKRHRPSKKTNKRKKQLKITQKINETTISRKNYTFASSNFDLVLFCSRCSINLKGERQHHRKEVEEGTHTQKKEEVKTTPLKTRRRKQHHLQKKKSDKTSNTQRRGVKESEHHPEGTKRLQHHPRKENNTTPFKNGNATPTKPAPPKKGRGKKAVPPKMRRATHDFTFICFSLL